MEYVKTELSKLFKENYRALTKSNEGLKRKTITPENNLIHKKNLYPRLRGLIYVSRLIMNMSEIELYIMPYKEMCILEKELCKPLNTMTC
jgi:hypothetical protein